MSDDDPKPAVPTLSELEAFEADPANKKLIETVRSLRQYDDFSGAEFIENFPNKLPRRFPLMLGKKVIGRVVVDWKAVVGHLFGAQIAEKPSSMSEEEYTAELKNYFESLPSKEQMEIILPSFSTMWHIVQFLPQKLKDAIVHLAVEGRQKVIMERQQEIGAAIPSPAKFADELLKMERANIRERLPKLQPSRTKPAWQSEANLRQFAAKVETRHLLCQCMKNVYDRCDVLEDWAEDLRHDEQFMLLSPEVPSKAITWAIRQIGDDKIDPRDKEALLIACEIARQELDLPFQEIQTLRGYYLEGSKLLRADRNQRKTMAKPRLASAPPTNEMDNADSELPTLPTDNADSP